MKIGIIGDLHIAPAPANRLDDYFQTGLNKIEEIAKVVDYAIFLGDIFTNSKVDDYYKNILISHLFYCKSKYNCQFATIIGNHDVSHEEEINLPNSSLGTLAACGAMTIILPHKPLEIMDGGMEYRFHTIPVKYKNAVEYIKDKKYNYNDILLIHHEYETGTNCFSYNDFKDLGCKMIFLGHDHKPFDEGRIIYPEFTIYRSGSIMRNRADDYNLNRYLYYYILENNQISCQPISMLDAKKVFAVESYERLQYQKRKFSESIDTIIDKYKNNINVQDKFSIKKILKELKIPDSNINYIKDKYKQIQEVFY